MLPFFFFFNATAPTEIYTLSLHDALPICRRRCRARTADSAAAHPARIAGKPRRLRARAAQRTERGLPVPAHPGRSEEHTSELQSHSDLVCRLLLEKKKKQLAHVHTHTTNV